MSTEDRFKAWAILELFGHKIMAGEVSEETLAGGVLVRIDVPEVPAIIQPQEKKDRGYVDIPAIPRYTKYFSPAAIYGITPTTEESAKAAAARFRAAPIDAFDIIGIVKEMAEANRAKALENRSFVSHDEDPED